MNIWMVYGFTESGDFWSLLFSGDRPNDFRIMDAIREDPFLFEEYEAECILGWEIKQMEVL